MKKRHSIINIGVYALQRTLKQQLQINLGIRYANNITAKCLQHWEKEDACRPVAYVLYKEQSTYRHVVQYLLCLLQSVHIFGILISETQRVQWENGYTCATR
jgi:hypothetical protein